MPGHALISATGALVWVVSAGAAAHNDFFSPAADTGVGSDQEGHGLLASNAAQVYPCAKRSSHHRSDVAVIHTQQASVLPEPCVVLSTMDWGDFAWLVRVPLP